jgi:hypothetical protein
MTIAIAIKVNDGIVLAADSASTILSPDPKTNKKNIWIIYNNANKVFNLIKGIHVGAISWGSGSIGQASIETLVKDFRKKVSDSDPEWKIDTQSYTIEDIAQKFRKFIFDQHYSKEFKDWPEKPDLGFLIVGYSTKRPLAEIWRIEINNGNCQGPELIGKEQDIGIHWFGEIEAIGRLYKGFSIHLPTVLEEAGLNPEQIKKVLQLSNERLTVPFVIPPMPVQDAINLARFLVDMTEQYSKYRPGAPTVGGPIEIAAITKHEGFKWIERKHYYDREYNPET